MLRCLLAPSLASLSAVLLGLTGVHWISYVVCRGAGPGPRQLGPQLNRNVRRTARRVDKVEARIVLKAELDKYRARAYSDLLGMDEPDTYVVTADSGVSYQLEIQVFWDGEPDGNIRVLGSIDDGGWRALAPVSRDFIMAPDGTFVDE